MDFLRIPNFYSKLHYVLFTICIVVLKIFASEDLNHVVSEHYVCLNYPLTNSLKDQMYADYGNCAFHHDLV